MRVGSARAILVMLCGLLVSCIWPPTACGCSPPISQGVVRGVVRAAATGAPVAEAQVQATLHQSACGGALGAITDLKPTTTDGVGRYRVTLQGYMPGSGCVRVLARGNGTDSVVVTRTVTPFRGSPPMDTVTIDLLLPSASARVAGR